MNGLSLIKASLGLITTVGFAAGPGGAVVSGIAATISFALGFIDGETSPKDLPQDIKAIDQQVLVNERIAELANHIVTYNRWLCIQNPADIAGGTDDYTLNSDQLNDLKREIANAVDPSFALSQAVTELTDWRESDPPIPFLGLSIYMLGSSLLLNFLKARLVLSQQRMYGSPGARELARTAKQHKEHLESVVNYLNKAKRERGIQDDQKEEFIYYDYIDLESEDPQHLKFGVRPQGAFYVVDDKREVFPKRDSPEHKQFSDRGWPDGVARPNVIAVRFLPESDDTDHLENEVKGWFDWYISDIKGEFYKHFGWSDEVEKEVQNAIKKLDEVISTYNPPSPPQSQFSGIAERLTAGSAKATTPPGPRFGWISTSTVRGRCSAPRPESTPPVTTAPGPWPRTFTPPLPISSGLPQRTGPRFRAGRGRPVRSYRTWGVSHSAAGARQI